MGCGPLAQRDAAWNRGRVIDGLYFWNEVYQSSGPVDPMQSELGDIVLVSLSFCRCDGRVLRRDMGGEESS